MPALRSPSPYETLSFVGTAWFGDWTDDEQSEQIRQLTLLLSRDSEFADQVRAAFAAAFSEQLSGADLVELVSSAFNRSINDEEAARHYLRGVRARIFGPKTT